MYNFVVTAEVKTCNSNKNSFFGGNSIKNAIINEYFNYLKNYENLTSSEAKLNTKLSDPNVLQNTKSSLYPVSNKIKYHNFIETIRKSNSDISSFHFSNNDRELFSSPCTSIIYKNLDNKSQIKNNKSLKRTSNDETEREIILSDSDDKFDLSEFNKRFPVIISYLNKVYNIVYKFVMKPQTTDIDKLTVNFYETILSIWLKDLNINFNIYNIKDTAIHDNILFNNGYVRKLKTFAGTDNIHPAILPKRNLRSNGRDYIGPNKADNHSYIDNAIDGKAFYKTIVEFVGDPEYKSIIEYYQDQPQAIVRDFLLLANIYTNVLTEGNENLYEPVEVNTLRKKLIGEHFKGGAIDSYFDKDESGVIKSLSFHLKADSFSDENYKQFRTAKDLFSGISTKDYIQGVDYNLKIHKSDDALSLYKIEDDFTVNIQLPDRTRRKNIQIRNKMLRFLSDIMCTFDENGNRKVTEECTTMESIIRGSMYIEFEDTIKNTSYSPRNYISFIKSDLPFFDKMSYLQSLLEEVKVSTYDLNLYDDTKYLNIFRNLNLKDKYSEIFFDLDDTRIENMRIIAKQINNTFVNYVVDSVVSRLDKINRENKFNINSLYKPENLANLLKSNSGILNLNGIEFRQLLGKVLTYPKATHILNNSKDKFYCSTITYDGLVILCEKYSEDSLYFTIKPIDEFKIAGITNPDKPIGEIVLDNKGIVQEIIYISC